MTDIRNPVLTSGMIRTDSADWRRFEAAISNPATRKVYIISVRQFFNHAQISNSDFVSLALKEPEKAEGIVLDYIQYMKGRAERKEIALGSVRARVMPVKFYCSMNRVRLDWEYISRTIPKSRRFADDRAPTREEIKRLLNLATLRIRVAIEMMASGGFRVGAWDYMTIRDIEPIQRGESLIAGKVTVYRGEPEQYFCFITPEAYRLFSEYMEYRKVHGEKLSLEAPAIRDEFAVSQGRRGTAENVKRFPSSFVERELCRVLTKSGLRAERMRRYEFKAAHGFRKFFKTQAEQVMRPANVEVLMGHSIGVSDSYYRPTEKQLLDDYLKAVPLLSITEAMDLHEIEEKLRAEFEDRLASLEGEMRQYLRSQVSSGAQQPLRATPQAETPGAGGIPAPRAEG
jgi:hypothetical protein